MNNSIDEIKSQLKTLKISIDERLTFVKNQLRETRNDGQPHTPVSINNRTDDTTHRHLVTELLKTRITELERQVADKNFIIEYLTKTDRKGTSQQWEKNGNQNITFTEEALNNENKK